MATVKQPTYAPTNKLSAALIGQIIGAVAYGFAEAYWPWLGDIQLDGIGGLSFACQIVAAGVLGYMIPDRPNT